MTRAETDLQTKMKIGMKVRFFCFSDVQFVERIGVTYRQWCKVIYIGKILTKRCQLAVGQYFGFIMLVFCKFLRGEREIRLTCYVAIAKRQ
ncbi:hypothetical protein D1872_248430 [compost metagenome]